VPRRCRAGHRHLCGWRGALRDPDAKPTLQRRVAQRLALETAEGAPAPAQPPGPAPLPIDRYPLERCAAIAASIARTRPETDRILAENELDPPAWQALDQHWNDEVRAQAGRGRTAPLKAYDAAYVAQLEKERGPIQVREYARLVVAKERGIEEETLAELSLPRGALLRLQRVWLARVAADPELGKGVREAMEAAREA